MSADPPRDDLIRYDVMVQEALLGVVRRVLIEAAAQGLPGDHHFYITFRSEGPGVRISSRLREKHPEEMTIVLQHQFWDLQVTDHGFEVGLSFGGVPERLLVPFDALTGFYDPSVQFGLKFAAGEAQADNDLHEEADADQDVTPLPPPEAAKPEKPAKKPRGKVKAEQAPPDEDEASRPKAGAEVVSLEAFRKKK